MAYIFISHNSKDNDKASEIFKELKKVSNSIFLDFDKDYGLKGGQEWEKELYKRIRRARIVITLLSPTWFESEWCYKEYCMARVYKKIVIPIVIKKSDKVFSWDGKSLQHYDFVNDSEALEKLISRIEELTKENISKLYDIKDVKSPFPGLESFNSKLAPFFYGRNDDILKAETELNVMSDRYSEKFLNIVGSSGVGKSSFMKAGVLPYLEFLHKDRWYILKTFKARENILIPLENIFAKFTSKDIIKELKAKNYKELFDDIERNIHKKVREENIEFNNLKILFSIDQAEELLLSNSEEKEIFFDLLKYLLTKRDNFYLIWTLRADYIKIYQQNQNLEFLRKVEKEFILHPIAMSEIKAIVQEPLYQIPNPIKVQEAVIEQIKIDLKTTTSLPLLAYLLEQLYKKAKAEQEKEIKLDFYKNFGKDGKNPIESVINKHAEDAFKKADNKDNVKRLFLEYLIKVDINSLISKKTTLLKNIPQDLHDIIENFVEKRLIVKDGNKESTTVSIAHEALIYSWDKLQEWIKEEEGFLVFKSQLELFYKLWLENDKDDRTLLSGNYFYTEALKYKNKFDYRIMMFIKKSMKKSLLPFFISYAICIAYTVYSEYQLMEEEVKLKNTEEKLANINYSLATLLKTQKSDEKHFSKNAIEYFLNSFELYKKLSKKDSRFLLNLDIVYYKIFNTYLQLKEYQRTLKLIKEVINIFENSTIKDKEEYLAYYYKNLATLYLLSKQKAKAKEAIAQAKELFKLMIKKYPKRNYLYTNLFLLSLVSDEEFNRKLEEKYLINFKDKKDLIYYEYRKVLSNISFGKEIDLEAFKQKYRSYNLKKTNFTPIEAWIELKEDNKAKQKLKEALKVFKKMKNNE